MLVGQNTPVVRGKQITENFFSDNVDKVAIALIGAIVVTEVENDGRIIEIEGQIIETEAYCQRDPAAHCFQNSRERERLRNGGPPRMHDAMYGPAGNVYIYPGEGDWCALNFVCGEERYGAGVLIRAIRGSDGCIDEIRKIRKEDWKNVRDNQLSAGPYTLCRAFKILPKLNKKSLTESGLQLFHPAAPPPEVIAAERVGITWKLKNAPPQPRRRYVMPGMRGYHRAIVGDITLSTDDLSIKQHAASIDRLLSGIKPD
jgi:DNA-3-methyladenine glycosylase